MSLEGDDDEGAEVSRAGTAESGRPGGYPVLSLGISFNAYYSRALRKY